MNALIFPSPGQFNLDVSKEFIKGQHAAASFYISVQFTDFLFHFVFLFAPVLGGRGS